MGWHAVKINFLGRALGMTDWHLLLLIPSMYFPFCKKKKKTSHIYQAPLLMSSICQVGFANSMHVYQDFKAERKWGYHLDNVLN
jgi:hypothetical protein